MATICGNFPIYSQTFVYQELVQLQAHGFEVRHMYSFDLPRTDLHAAFAVLWPRRRRLVHDYGHGGSGFTLAWGCAEEVAALLHAAPR